MIAIFAMEKTIGLQIVPSLLGRSPTSNSHLVVPVGLFTQESQIRVVRSQPTMQGSVTMTGNMPLHLMQLLGHPNNDYLLFFQTLLYLTRYHNRLIRLVQ